MIRLQVEPGTDIAFAHRKAVNAALGEIIDSFQYDETTGEILLSTRPIPAFGVLEKESEESKIVAQLIKDFRAQDAVLRKRAADSDAREAQVLFMERELNKMKLDHARDIKQLEGERIAFERDKGEVIKMGAFAGLKSFFHRIK